MELAQEIIVIKCKQMLIGVEYYKLSTFFQDDGISLNPHTISVLME